MENLEFGENQLFQGRYGPLTWGIGFVKMPYQETVDAFWRWQEEIGKVKRYQLHQRELKGGFEEALLNLSPLHERFISKRLFVPTRSQWTAYFDNQWLGGEPDKVGILSMREHCQAVAVRSTPLRTHQHAGKKYRTGGLVTFTLFGKKQGDTKNNYDWLRVVGVSFDETKWEFHNVGEYLRFENIEAYSRQRIRDRFTPEMLVEYARHFSIDPFEESFYRVGPDSPAVLIEAQIDVLNRRPVVSMSLEEVQLRLGLRNSDADA